MGVLAHVKNIYKAMTESNDTYVPEEMSDKEREAILKSDKGYKEYMKTDSKVKSTEQSVKDYMTLIDKMEEIKEETLDIRNVMTESTRAAMMKYHPEAKGVSKSKSVKKEHKTSDREIGE